MTTARHSRNLILGFMAGLAVLVLLLDIPFPKGQTSAMLFVAVVCGALWLPGTRPVYATAAACTLLTFLGHFLSGPGPVEIDLMNRAFSALAFWLVAALCVVYKRTERQTVRLAGIVESSDDAILSKTLDGHIVSWNAGAEQLFGYSAAEAVGRPVSLVFPPDRLAEEAHLVETIRRGERVHHFETARRRKDGSLVPVSLSASPIREPGGQIVGIASIARNVTERKRMEEELRQTLERFRLAGRATNDALWDWDLATNAIWFSESIRDLFGYRPEDVGADVSWWLDRVHPDDAGRVYDEVKAVLAQGGRAWSGEYRFRRADGTWATVLDRAYVVHDRGGGPVRMVGSMMDITDRKRTEAELRQAKEAAEVATRAKSEFLANMSHEIRTPMNGVLGMLDLVLDTELRPEQRHHLDRAKGSADQLLRVINDILDFSKIEAGRLDLELIDFGLREALGEAVKMFGPRAHQKGLELALDVHPDVPDGLVGDPVRLGQVVTNLVGNAVKFTDRGEVVVRARAEPAADGRVTLHLTVSDTGPGIPPDTQRRIFQAFTQADGSMARRYGGTGLGLAIASQLAGLMGGRVWVESAVGKGSTFHVTARFDRSQRSLFIRAGGKVDLDGLPVLVVDDNETNRDILAGMLARWRMRPTAVADGQAALAELRRAADAGEPYPVVLLDAMMPDLDGFAVAARIRDDPRLAGVTILMLSSADRPGETARCAELGVAAYLRKPIKQSELLDAILRALGQLTEGPPATAAAEPVPEVSRPLRVLLAEDVEVNQVLAVALLRKRGHTVAVANNGQEAVAAWEREPFDLILMDVQMPELDGLAATAAIREREKATGAHIPIVALTAHAMAGDRERCLAAGMDGYVTKPVRAAELFGAIAALFGGPGPDRPVAGSGTGSSAREAVLDLGAALAGADGDRELLGRLARRFLDRCPALVAEVREAVGRGDAAAVERAAHKLKGAVGNFAAGPAGRAAGRLEALGRAGDAEACRGALADLEGEVTRLQQALREVAAGDQA